jgi:hypothetical protein
MKISIFFVFSAQSLERLARVGWGVFKSKKREQC